MIKNNARVSCFDGLRGWAALVVCMAHTVGIFGVPHPTKFFIIVQNEYLKALFDGALSVRIFFVLSGVVLSISFIKNPDFKKLAALLIKRIPRLSIPIFAMSLIAHFLMKSGLMLNLRAYEAMGYSGYSSNLLSTYYYFTSSIFKVFESSFLLPFFGDKEMGVAWNLYSGVLWTMPHEMVGSIFVAVALFLASFISKGKRFIPIIISFVALVFLSYQKALFASSLTCFLFGILLAYYFVNKSKDAPPPLVYSLCYKILLAIIILWLYYYNFNLDAAINSNLIDMKRNLIAILIVFLVISSSYLQKILSSKISIFLGKISFPLYLIHMTVICSFTSFLIIKKYDPNNTILVLRYCIATVVVSIIAACLLYPVEKFAVAFSHRVFDYFCNDKKIEFGKIRDFIDKVKKRIGLKI